jgi:hypothetical protein
MPDHRRCAASCESALRPNKRGKNMSITTILIIILVLALVGALPAWPYSRGWGYYPSGIAGIVVLILIVLLLMGRI